MNSGRLAGRVAVVTRGVSPLGREGASLAIGDPGPDAAAEVASEGIASLSAFPMRRTSSRSSPDTMRLP